MLGFLQYSNIFINKKVLGFLQYSNIFINKKVLGLLHFSNIFINKKVLGFLQYSNIYVNKNCTLFSFLLTVNRLIQCHLHYNMVQNCVTFDNRYLKAYFMNGTKQFCRYQFLCYEMYFLFLRSKSIQIDTKKKSQRHSLSIFWLC